MSLTSPNYTFNPHAVKVKNAADRERLCTQLARETEVKKTIRDAILENPYLVDPSLGFGAISSLLQDQFPEINVRDVHRLYRIVSNDMSQPAARKAETNTPILMPSGTELEL